MKLNLISICVIIISSFPFLFNGYLFLDLMTNVSNNFKPVFLYASGLLISILIALLAKLGISKLSKNDLVFRKDGMFVGDNFIIKRNLACSFMDLPKIELGKINFDPSKYAVVSLYTLFYGYVIGYLLLAKIILNRGPWTQSDTFKLIVSLLYSFIHIFFYSSMKCVHGYEELLGLLLGMVLGFSWNLIVKPKKEKRTKYCGLISHSGNDTYRNTGRSSLSKRSRKWTVGLRDSFCKHRF